MCITLIATGWVLRIDQSWSPTAVVVLVVIYNASFGFSWGPIPW